MGDFEKKPIASLTTPLLPSPSPDSSIWPTYTVDEAIESLSLGRFQYLVLGLAGLCWTADAMEMLLLSFIKPPLQCLWQISDVQAALITTSVGVGMLCGALIWGLIADVYGRRPTFISAASLTFIFGLLSSVAPSYHAMLFTRGVVGFGIGGVPIAFSLVMEFLPAKSRGFWGMGLAIFWSLGAMFEAALAMILMPVLGFRALIACSTLPLGILLLFTPMLPESPRWLAAQGRVREARSILQRAANVNDGSLPKGVLVAVEISSQPEKTPVMQLTALVRPGLRGLSMKIWFLWFASAFVYYGSVMLQPDLLAAENLGFRCNYAHMQCARQMTSGGCRADSICVWIPTSPDVVNGNKGVAQCVASGTGRGRALLQGIGENSLACKGQLRYDDYKEALFSTSGELPGTLFTLAIVDVIGRRPLLGYLFAMCAFAFVVLLPCPGRFVETMSFFASRAASNGFFQAIFLYTNEIYPSEVRATGMGLASAIARVGLISTPLVAQFLDNINFGLAIWIYSAVCVVGLLVVWETPIETTRRPLFSTMDELVDCLQTKNVEEHMGPSFGNDPAVHSVIRMMRWNARIDGKASHVSNSAV